MNILIGNGFGTDVVLPAVIKVLLQKIIDEAVQYATVLWSNEDSTDEQKQAMLQLYMQSRLTTTNLIAKPLLGIVRAILEGSIPLVIKKAKARMDEKNKT
jgi:hypothetical protein